MWSEKIKHAELKKHCQKSTEKIPVVNQHW